MAHIIKLNSRHNNKPVLINLDHVDIIIPEAGDKGSRIYFKKSKVNEVVSQNIEEIYQIVFDNKNILKG